MSHAIRFSYAGDQMVLYYGFAHKSIKWWKRVFFHILDLSLLNAHLLYLASGNKMTQLEFRQAVAKSLLEGYERQRGHHTTPRAPELPLRHAPSSSRPRKAHAQTAGCAVTEQKGNATRQGIDARDVKLPCAHTLVWSAITR